MENIKDFDEIPKHRKKKESNTSKGNRKTKHKHEYVECLIRYPFMFCGEKRLMTYLSSYCTICGKIGDRVKDSIVNPEGCETKRYSGDELYDEFKDKLPVFVLNDFSEKYVPVNVN